MCHKQSSSTMKVGNKIIRVDTCMMNLVHFINKNTEYKSVATCCGHFRYPPSLILKFRISEKSDWIFFDVFSGVPVHPKNKKIYKKDRKGFYFLPGIHKERA